MHTNMAMCIYNMLAPQASIFLFRIQYFNYVLFKL